MRRFITAATAVVAVFCCTAGIAAAGVGDPGTVGPPTTGGSQGKGTQTDKYKVAYTDPVVGPVACAGVHQTGKNFGVWGQDSFTCTSTTGSPLANYGPGQVASGGWFSDYYYYWLPSPVYVLGSFTATVSDDGFSYTGVAKY